MAELMSKAEALLALDDGKPVRFRTWWWKRYVQKLDGILRDEKGVIHREEMLIVAEEGWEIYNEAVHGLEG